MLPQLTIQPLLLCDLLAHHDESPNHDQLPGSAALHTHVLIFVRPGRFMDSVQQGIFVIRACILKEHMEISGNQYAYLL